MDTNEFAYFYVSGTNSEANLFDVKDACYLAISEANRLGEHTNLWGVRKEDGSHVLLSIITPGALR